MPLSAQMVIDAITAARDRKDTQKQAAFQALLEAVFSDIKPALQDHLEFWNSLNSEINKDALDAWSISAEELIKVKQEIVFDWVVNELKKGDASDITRADYQSIKDLRKALAIKILELKGSDESRRLIETIRREEEASDEDLEPVKGIGKQATEIIDKALWARADLFMRELGLRAPDHASAPAHLVEGGSAASDEVLSDAPPEAASGSAGDEELTSDSVTLPPETPLSPEEVKRIMNQVANDIAQARLHSSHFSKQKEKIDSLISENPLAYARLPSTAAEEMRTLYRDFSQDISTSLTRLQEEHQKFVAHQQMIKRILQQEFPHEPSNELRDPSIPLRNRFNDLAREIELLDRKITFYEEVQEKLNGEDGLIANIGALHKKQYVLTEGVTSYLTTTAQLKPVDTSSMPVEESADMTVDRLADSEVIKLQLAERPGTNQIRAYDFVYKGPSETTYTARMVYDAEYGNKSVTAIKSGNTHELVRSRPGKFSLKFPKAVDGRGKEPEEELKIKYALDAALQILASMDSLPDRDNPVTIRGGKDQKSEEYLHAALAALIGSDKAVRAVGKFDPKSAKAGILSRYKEDSIYYKLHSSKSEYAQYAQLVKERKETLKQLFSDKETKKLSDTATKITKFRSELRDKHATRSAGTAQPSTLDTGGEIPGADPTPRP